MKSRDWIFPSEYCVYEVGLSTSFKSILDIVWNNIPKGQGGAVNQKNPPQCTPGLAFSKIGFFWFEPSKPLANWLESWVSTGWNSLCLCFINEKSSPRQKGSVDDDHFVMPVQQNEKISNQDPAQAEGTKPLLLLHCLKEYCFILFIYLRLSLEDWNHLKLNNEHWRN